MRRVEVSAHDFRELFDSVSNGDGLSHIAAISYVAHEGLLNPTAVS